MSIAVTVATQSAGAVLSTSWMYNSRFFSPTTGQFGRADSYVILTGPLCMVRPPSSRFEYQQPRHSGRMALLLAHCGARKTKSAYGQIGSRIREREEKPARPGAHIA